MVVNARNIFARLLYELYVRMCNYILGGSSKHFLHVHPTWGFMLQFDLRICFNWVRERSINYNYANTVAFIY